MPEANDMELLREYGRNGSESAFAELVRRHINLVYSVALRHVGIIAQAEEITQAVFIILARKAARLRPDTILEGWLHTTTRLTALSFLRGERRRQFREQEAYMQSTIEESGSVDPYIAWEQMAPLLDEAILRLGKKDRDALVLRFFKDKGLREVAGALQVSEAAAQRRILRALEKLHRFFTKRGISSTTAIIAGEMAAHSVQAVPVALAKSVTAVAIVKGSIAAVSTMTLVKGTMNIMAWLKLKFAFGIGATMLIASSVVAFAFLDDKTSDPAADEILNKMQAKYASLSSYSDTGTSTSEQFGSISFVTELGRPNYYRIKWRSRASATNWIESAVWSQGEGDFMLLRSPGRSVRENYYRMKDRDSALEKAASRGGWSIPPIFFASELPGQSYAFKAYGKEQINGVDCFVLTGHLKAAKDLSVTFWIGTNDFLIHQSRRITLERTGGGGLPELAKIQQSLGDKPTPEQVREANKKMREVKINVSNPPLAKVSTTETHENILINQQVKVADFSYSVSDSLKPEILP